MTSNKLVTLEVNGQPIEAPVGSMLIDATDRAGISVPRFCYHKKLSVAANCRMCLVEVTNLAKPVPACATPVTAGMKVFTQSKMALEAQKGTLEFLLINHPLDCPICDQGGECQLQDVAMGYGMGRSRFVEGKRVVSDPDLGPLIATDMTRCIHCTRCVRFGEEIAGVRELGATGRGEHTRIGTFVQRSVNHELSGNVIDLCPVGALTSKPFRFTARAWELQQRDGIAPHDSLGSHTALHVRRNRVLRVHPRGCESLNETWLSDRDRFGYEGIQTPDRVMNPLIKEQGVWRETDWREGITLTVKALTGQSVGRLGALASPQATLEELYLLQKLVRGLGSPHIDHRVRQGDFRMDKVASGIPWLGMRVADLESLDAVLVVGSDIRKEHPLLAHRLRKAALRGAAVAFINPYGLDLAFTATQWVDSPQGMMVRLATLASLWGVANPDGLGGLMEPALAAFGERFKTASTRAILFGNLAVAHADFSVLLALASDMSQATGATLGVMPETANNVGAWLAGAIPHRGSAHRPAKRIGLDAQGMIQRHRPVYILFGLEPGRDGWNAYAEYKALKQAGLVLAFSAYRSSMLEDVAHIILPMACFAETEGTFVNC
ncbi:MAG: NADH-quinone oxidoreductase subunit NuoG, partial [Pseudomonadota bacterium]